jgi:hypothetical protein
MIPIAMIEIKARARIETINFIRMLFPKAANGLDLISRPITPAPHFTDRLEDTFELSIKTSRSKFMLSFDSNFDSNI